MAEAETERPDIPKSGSQPDSLPRTGDDALTRILHSIDDLGLRDNLIELETEGFTTLKGVLDEHQVERARAAIVGRAERESGKKIDPDTASEADYAGMNYLPYMLYDDEIFQEIMLEPKPLAMITYLLGESCVLSSIGSHFKGPGETGVIPLHSDAGNGIPTPFPPYSFVANVNYALTPYSRDAGALALVPHSHRLARQPTTREMMLSGDKPNRDAISMDLSPGDAVVWHGNTWHGSFPRNVPGVRINLAVYFARQFIVTQERHKGVVPQDVLDRHANNPRFKTLVGGDQPYGWQNEGPNFEMMAKTPRGLYD